MKSFRKSLKRSRRDDAEEASGDEQVVKQAAKPNKKSKTASGDAGKDAEGNPFWTLSSSRRAGISSFKGKVLINIREYWTDASGDLKPGKKGISLPLDQYKSLLEAIPAINAELREQGHDVPDLATSASNQPAADLSEADEKQPTPEKKKKPTKQKKSNIEATSDEDNEDGEED